MIYNSKIGAGGNIEFNPSNSSGSIQRVSKTDEDPSQNFDRMLRSSQEKIKDKEEAPEDLDAIMLPFGQLRAIFSNVPSYSFNPKESLQNKGLAPIGDIQLQNIKKETENNNNRKENAVRTNVSSEKEAKAKIQEVLTKILAENAGSNNAIGGSVSFSEFIKDLENASGRENIRSIAEKILDKIKFLKSGDKTMFSIELKPEWLGSIKVDITSVNGKINVAIFAGEKSKELLDSGLAELENMLKNANLNIGSVQVSIGGGSQNDNAEYDTDEDEKNTFRLFPLISRTNDNFVQSLYNDSSFIDKMVGMNYSGSSIFSKI